MNVLNEKSQDLKCPNKNFTQNIRLQKGAHRSEIRGKRKYAAALGLSFGIALSGFTATYFYLESKLQHMQQLATALAPVVAPAELLAPQLYSGS